MKDLKDSLINQKVAEKLREKRGGLRLSFEDVAERSGVPLSTVRRIFYPKQDIATSHLTAIAGALGTTAADIMRAAMLEVGEDAALADVTQILLAKRQGVSEARGTVTELHPRDMTAEQIETMVTRRAAYDDPEAETDEPDTP